MTLSTKILAAAAQQETASPGEILNVRVDIAYCNDVNTNLVINNFRGINGGRVFDPRKIYFIADHFTPCKDVKAAEQVRLMRSFAAEHGIEQCFFAGNTGVEHCLMPEQGIIYPNDIVIGADSHTCTMGALGAFATGVGSTDFAALLAEGEIWLKVPQSIRCVYSGRPGPFIGGKDIILFTLARLGGDGALYKALEFVDATEDKIPMESRFTIANMSVEAGAKTGLFAQDAVTEEYIRRHYPRLDKPLCGYQSDADALYETSYEFKLSGLEPQVACPSAPDLAVEVSKVSGQRLDQVVIGGCTNGWLDDMRAAAAILRGRKAARGLNLIIIPGSPHIYQQALKEGLVEIFMEAGATVSAPTCGPCVGGHMGVLAEEEICLSTTNRNFKGRMGAASSEIYLSGAAVAAASAVAGQIIHPAEVAR